MLFAFLSGRTELELGWGRGRAKIGQSWEVEDFRSRGWGGEALRSCGGDGS